MTCILPCPGLRESVGPGVAAQAQPACGEAAADEVCVKAIQPSLHWMGVFLKAMMRCAGNGKEYAQLPAELCHIIYAFGRDCWVVRHSGMTHRGNDAACVVANTRTAYPVVWSHGVHIPATGCLSLDLRVDQCMAPKDEPMDDRYMVGLAHADLLLANDYPAEELGMIFAFEFSGRIVYSDDHCDEIGDLRLRNQADVELRISRETRSVDVFVDGIYRGGSWFPKELDLGDPCLYPFAVLNAKRDEVTATTGIKPLHDPAETAKRHHRQAHGGPRT